MTDHEALVAAIRHEPVEDTPRYAFTDYIEGEMNRPIYAQFVRYQLDGKNQKAYDLMIQYGSNVATGWDWVSVKPGIMPVRGFYEECTFEYPILKDFGDFILRTYPVLTVNLINGTLKMLKECEERWNDLKVKFVIPDLGGYGTSGSFLRISGLGTTNNSIVSWGLGHSGVLGTFWSTSSPQDMIIPRPRQPQPWARGRNR